MRVLLYAGMVVALLVILAPFAWLIISSVAAPVDLLERPLKWIPAHITFDRFAELTFGGGGDENAEGFRAALVNSTIIAGAVTALSLVVGTPAAYAFARLRFPGRGWLILAFMATYMLPPIALILPLYQIMGALNLLDTRLALIVIYASFVTPFVIWIMRGYISSISSDLDDAARVDGASRLGVLWRVIIPISIPGLLSTAGEVRSGVDRLDRLVVEPDRAGAIALAVEFARPGDVVLVAGKGHETGQQIGGRTLDFDDRVVTRAAIEDMAGARR